MSRGKGKGPQDYEVGYGKPSRLKMFQPGQSGNPKGRPKKAKGAYAQMADAMDQPTREMFMQEMYRPITIRNGAEETTMSTMQVITRAMVKKAAEGGQQAQRTAIMLQIQLEKEFAELNNELLELARDTKAKWGPKLARLRAEGLPEPDVLPHPDDIIIDEEARRVHINGPSTAEQRAALNEILAERDRYAATVVAWRARGNRDPRFWDVPVLIKREQDRFDILNDLVPERYRVTLEGRMTPEEIDTALAVARKHLAQRDRRRTARNAAPVTQRARRQRVRVPKGSSPP